MRKIAKSCLSFKNWLFTTLLGVLGFSACDIIGRVEYGMPNANHTLKGTVSTLENVAIPGIRVIVKDQDNRYEPDTLQTDNAGKYQFTDVSAWPGSSYTVLFEDVDGAEHGGSFVSKTATATFNMDDYENGDGWYEGEQTVVLNVQLDK